ncbi:rhomboid family intramembrane serine protease [Rhizobium sp. L1K21]|uniref:rhomboid family intramembrane serine protease n=1 Tax=Rhizobium sp. L1K21 TaxID=2954933 RepID=UPI0020924DD2|nr:rhomboid family intramembrane serine protease [Rhizobium sp. L1K21]MCO6186115.1 rhomboid family intramembrane serine protease [Rhizobium sp. L1K21]
MEENRETEQDLRAEPQAHPVRRSEPAFNLPVPVTVSLFILFAIQVVISAFSYLAPGSTFVQYIYFYGGFIAARYSAAGMAADLSWLWSPVTYSLLHGGWEHLIFNSIWLAVFGSPVARRIGAFRYVIFWVFAAIVSAFAFWVLQPASSNLLVGASGVISAFTGAACRFVWSPRRGPASAAYGMPTPLLSIGDALTNRSVLSFVVIWFVANVLFAALGSFGGAMAIAWEAHLGGFLVGFLLFPLFDRPHHAH